METPHPPPPVEPAPAVPDPDSGPDPDHPAAAVTDRTAERAGPEGPGRGPVSRWRRVASAAGLTTLPPGRRPPPGAGLRRITFAFVWLVLGVIELSIRARGGTWVALALGVSWLVLGGVDLIRARQLLAAEHRHLTGGDPPA